MKKILLTLDYELYGNGTGNIYTHIIKPTNSILAIANKYNAKLTIFVEIVVIANLTLRKIIPKNQYHIINRN